MRRMIQLVVTLSILGLVAPMAQAAVKEFPTSLTLTADDSQVPKGRRVTFVSVLSSTKSKCYVNRSVALFENGIFISHKRTDSIGQVSFSRRVYATSNWRAKFLGLSFGTYPTTKRCVSSMSDEITVIVT